MTPGERARRNARFGMVYMMTSRQFNKAVQHIRKGISIYVSNAHLWLTMEYLESLQTLSVDQERLLKRLTYETTDDRYK